MQRRSISTPDGDLQLWGEAQAFEGSRPVILVLAGAFAALKSLWPLTSVMPDFDIFFGHLPGIHNPEFRRYDLAGIAAAFDTVLTRPTVVLGFSAGAVVGLSLESEWVRGMVAVEPVLRPLRAWPLKRLWTITPQNADFLWEFFGFATDRVADRNYLPLLSRSRPPTTFILGDVPLLPKRALDKMPSLLAEEERQAIVATGSRVVVVEALGHDLGNGASDVIVDELRRLCVATLR